MFHRQSLKSRWNLHVVGEWKLGRRLTGGPPRQVQQRRLARDLGGARGGAPASRLRAPEAVPVSGSEDIHLVSHDSCMLSLWTILRGPGASFGAPTRERRRHSSHSRGRRRRRRRGGPGCDGAAPCVFIAGSRATCVVLWRASANVSSWSSMVRSYDGTVSLTTWSTLSRLPPR